MENPVAVTPEGIPVKVAPEKAPDTSILKNAAEKTKGVGKGVEGAVEKVSSMSKLFEKNDFGKALSKCTQKTKDQIYEITEKMPEYGLRKGDRLYLDKLHKDHLEVFDKYGNALKVLNLDGSINSDKTFVAVQQKRTIEV